MLTEDTVVKVSSNQVASELGDEKIILELENGIYYGLNAVGGRVWRLLQEPLSLQEVRDQLLQEYEVDMETCERDLFALIEDLDQHNLIEICT